MPLTVEHQKEALGQAYVRAVVAKAGFNFGKTEFDYGIDGIIKDVINRNGRYCDSGFGINFRKKLQSENVNGTVEVLLFVIYIYMVMVTVQPWVIHDVLNIG